MKKRFAMGMMIIVINLGLGLAAVQAATVFLNGTQGNVNVVEFTDAMSGPEGGYFVDVLNGSTSIFGFAVSTNFVSAGIPGTGRPGWSAQIFTDQFWDANQNITSGGGLKTLNIGTFASLFGSEDNAANVYFLDAGGVNITENDNMPFDPLNLQFFFGGVAQSEFVAFNAQGGIIDQSFAAVPAPSAMLLMGSGLIGLIGRRWWNAKNT